MNVKRILWMLALCVGLLSGAAEAAIVYETVQPLPQKEAGDKAAVEWQRERQLQALRLQLLPQAQEKLRAALPAEDLAELRRYLADPFAWSAARGGLAAPDPAWKS